MSTPDAGLRADISKAGRNCVLALRLLEFADSVGDLELAAQAAACAENESARAFALAAGRSLA